MFHLILGIHLVLCLVLIGLVLLQQGKGANMGAAFGGANSATVFGAAGAATMLTKVTTIVAICFMTTSIFLVRHYSSLAESTATVEVDPLTGSVMNSVATTSESVGTTAETDAATEEADVMPQAEPAAQPQEVSPSEASEGQ